MPRDRVHQPRVVAEEIGAAPEGDARNIAPEQVPRLDPAQMLREQFVYGDPAQCHAQLTALHARCGINSLRCVFNANGLLDNRQALAGMTLFAQEVLPALRKPVSPGLQT